MARNEIEKRIGETLTKLEKNFLYEPEKLPILANYLPDFVSYKDETLIEVKGIANSDDRSKMINASLMYTSSKSYLHLRADAPDAVQQAAHFFRQNASSHGHTVQLVEIPRIRKFIVAPLLTDAQLRDEHLWRHTYANRTRQNVVSGRGLVLWCDSQGIDCTPVSLNDHSRLIRRIG